MTTSERQLQRNQLIDLTVTGLSFGSKCVARLGEQPGDFELRPIVGMADPWRYRNRADFSIGMSENGAAIGFRPPGHRDTVLPFSECHLLNESIESVRGTGHEAGGPGA